MNTIFSYFKEKPIKSIFDLCNEFTLYQLILSIEPNLKKIDLEHGSNYSIKHKNFSNIVEIISNYITFHPDRVYFTPEADFALRLKIDEIIKSNKEQAVLIAEMVLFLSGISKNRESINRLDDCNDQAVMIYFNVQQKYSNKFNNDDDNENEENIEDNKDLENQNIQISLLCEKLKKEIQDKNRTILELQSHYDELENKYNLNNKELVHLKSVTDTEFLAKEDLINQQILNDSLNNEINELKITNNNIKNEYESKIKALNYKLSVSNEKIVEAQLESEKYKSYMKENQRLKEKINLLNTYKDTDKKIAEYEKIINGKNDLIQELTKEKNKIQDKNISLIKELSQLKQDLFNLENKNLSLENELRKINNEYQELKLNQNQIKISKKINKKESTKEINLSQALLEDDDEEEKEDFKQKYLDTKDELDMYKNIVNPLTEEKDNLENEIIELKKVIEKLGGNKNNNIKDGIGNENINNKKENGEGNQDKEINALKQKINEQNNISEELRKIVDDKEKKNDHYKKNLSEMQEQLDTYKNAVGLLTEEKGEHINEIQKLKEMNKKLEQELSFNNNINNKDILSINSTNNNKYSESAEKEIKELKDKIAERDGLIETLQGIISGEKNINEIKKDEEDYKHKYNKLKEEKEELDKKIILSGDNNKKLEEKLNNMKKDNDILNKEINELKNKNIIFNDDNDYKIMKKKLDELNTENENIKNKSNLEHQLISSSMFELAIQFYQIKKELEHIKNLENSDSSLSWIEMERKKNFPCEYYN